VVIDPMHPTRSYLSDLAVALREVEMVLERYDAAKGSKWLTQSVKEHVEHLFDHASKALDDYDEDHRVAMRRELAHCATRALMALALV